MVWKCLPTLSSFVSPLVKPDHPGAGQAKNQLPAKREDGKRGGNARCFLPADRVKDDVCWGEGAWMCLFFDIIMSICC